MDNYVPALESSFLGTGSEDFLSSSNKLGEMVRKSTPASALISPTYKTEHIRICISSGSNFSDGVAHVTERGTHNDGLVAVLFIVVEDLLH